MSWARELLFKLKETKLIFPRAFYYSFSMAYVIVITFTLILMFFEPRGVVPVYEPNLAIRVLEIGIGFWLVGYTLKLMKTDFRRFFYKYKIKKEITDYLNYIKKENKIKKEITDYLNYIKKEIMVQQILEDISTLKANIVLLTQRMDIASRRLNLLEEKEKPCWGGGG